MIHLGNVFCILSALLLGPLYGGFSAGIGSFIFDLTSPIYISLAPFTLIFKFLMAFTCGKIAYSKENNGNNIKLNTIAAIVGLIAYIILNSTRTFIGNIFLGIDTNANFILVGQSALVSLINAALAVVISVPLSVAINKSLKKLVER